MRYSIERAADPVSGLEVIRMRAPHACASIAPQMGGNLFSFIAHGHELLMQPENGLQEPGVKYGIPILFPTPNRVPGGVYSFEGRQYLQQKDGQPRLIHGLVCDEVFVVDELSADETGVQARLSLTIAQGSALYRSFPFACRLEVIWRLEDTSILMRYTVENLSDASRLPFGFALHPFFGKIAPVEEIFLSAPAGRAMEATAGLFPTGRLLDVADTALDIRAPRALSSLDLDTVFIGMDSGKCALAEYRSLGRTLTLNASDDFTHLVVYTPGNRNCFCIENQTCSTNAHNLFAQGLKEESHLLILEPGASHAGSVRIAVQ